MREPRETSPLANIDCPPMSEADRERARRTVCHFATSVEDAADLMAMLGLTDPGTGAAEPARKVPAPIVRDSGRCCKCNVSTYSARTEAPHPAARRYGARGMCETCYQRVRRTETPRPASAMVDSGKTIDHLHQLRAAGVSAAQISRAAGISETTLSRIMTRRPVKIRATTADALLKLSAQGMAVRS